MADNTTLNTGSGGDTIRTEDRTTYKTPVSLIDVGGTASEAIIGDSGVAMPVRGLAAENAAVSGNPVLIGGRYDATPRTLGDGDAGAVALDAAGGVVIASMTTLLGCLDGVETLLTTIDGRVDGLEALLTTQAGYLDGVETLLTTLAGAVSGTEMQVDVLTLPDVTIAAAQTLATVTTVTTLTGGGVAHDSADSGNPHKIGGKATTAQSGLTLVANADRTDAMFAADGSQLVRNVCLEDVVQERTTNTDGASTAFASGLGAPGAGLRLWITNVDLCNTSASDITVDLRDGSAGSVLWTLPVPAGGGVVKHFDPPLKLSANTALAFDASAATTTLTISANGFKSKI